MIWGLGTDIIMGLLTAVLLSVLMSEVYAQIPPPPPPPSPPPLVTPVIDPQMSLHADLMSDLENATLVNATLYEDGTAVLLFEPETPQYFPGFGAQRLVIEVHTLHPYTPQAGYQFEKDENGTTKIYSEAGNEFVMIQRNGTPGVEIVEGSAPEEEKPAAAAAATTTTIP